MKRMHRIVIPYWLAKGLVLPFFVLMLGTLHAQLIESAEITSLMQRWKSYNLEHQEVDGYRIQILATIDRRQMESVKRTFENRYPDYPIHSTQNEPYFQLRTGAFMTMQKAQAFMKMLQKDYPAAIPVTDVVKEEELILYDQ